MLLFLSLATGCKSLLKLTYKNDDFEWVAPQNLAKIVIQSSRDVGFRFVVSDAETIAELYEDLSAAMPVEEKNPLDPDYIFEFTTYENKVLKYYYTTGIGAQETGGNFYNEEGAFVVLDRIDNNLIKNLFALRKPQDFYNGYYGSILEAVRAVRADHPQGKFGVMISEDKEMLKFQMSYEILEFNLELNALDVHPIFTEQEVDLTMNVKTRGYKTNLYKAVAEVRDNTSRKTEKYYIVSDYKDGVWTTAVSKDMPSGF